jgi:outer membrane immunogenic protein
MKKLAIAVSVLSISAASAFAADLPARTYTKAPPMMAVYDWSGFYIGANGGYGWSRKCWDLNSVAGVTVPVAAEGCHDATGGVAGGQIGYRWQTSAWVFGFEAQGDWANLRGSSLSNPAAFGAAVTNRSKIDAFGLFAGQVGYAWNNSLLYVKSGVAVTSDKYRGVDTATGALLDSARETRIGYAAGVGLEYGFAPNWSAAVEYNRFFMDTNAVNLTTPAGANSRVDNVRQDVDLVTARVNYRWGGPAVAKY